MQRRNPSASRGPDQTPAPSTRPIFDLFVLEGDDAGQQFTIDAPEVSIGHRSRRGSDTQAILLLDRTVSSQQAVIRATDHAVRIEHRQGATNPTLVNGQPISSQPLTVGDHIQMGRVVLEVRAHEGASLTRFGGVTEVYPRDSDGMGTGDPTKVLQFEPRRWYLYLTGDGEGRRIDLKPGENTLGRSHDSDVRISSDYGVSRRHAMLLLQGENLVLIHLSRTNVTLVNGTRVESRRHLSDGDEIQLAYVRLRVEREAPAGAPVGRHGIEAGPQNLLSRMEDKIKRDQEIEKEFKVFGSFLDIDVVGSYGMKQGALAEHIIVSFERWRDWVRNMVEQFDGQVLNSNGDELMCFFESSHQAVRGASAVLDRLDGFNAEQNLLELPFRLRMGVHTGDSLVDRSRGVAFSCVLDTAGHLQKHAQTNGLLISQDTLKNLPPGLPFEAAGKLPGEGISTSKLVAPLD